MASKGTAARLLQVAAKDVGYYRHDDPDHGTKFGRWYAELTGDSYFGQNGIPFCAMAASYWLDKAGVPCAGLPSAYVPDIASAARKKGKTVSARDSKPGDVVCFDWDGGLADHVGIVEKNTGTHLQTIEGNSPAGYVSRRTRAYSTVECCVRPDFKAASTDGYLTASMVRQLQEQLGTSADGVISGQDDVGSEYFWAVSPDAVTYTGEGSTCVAELQSMLAGKGFDAGDVDGLYGPSSIKAHQGWLADAGYYGGDIDGYHGTETNAAMKKALAAGRYEGGGGDVSGLRGIDVSSWQDGIDLAKVPGDFVICKATEGASYTSGDFSRQMKQAKAAGKLIGAYHYVTGAGYESEGDHFLKVADPYVGTALLCLDWESGGNSKWGKESYLKSLAEYVYKKSGVKPVIYVQQSRMAAVKKVLPGYKLWIAQYASYDKTGYQSKPWNEGAYSCFIRQYSSSGRLSGYSGDLDLNKAYCTKAEWKAAAAKASGEKTLLQCSPTGYWGTKVTRVWQALNGIDETGIVYRQPESAKRFLKAMTSSKFGNHSFRFVKDSEVGEGSLAIKRLQNRKLGIPWKSCTGVFDAETRRLFIKKYCPNYKQATTLCAPSTAVKNFAKEINAEARAKGIKR